MRIETTRYVVWLGRGTAPGWNVPQRFRLREDEVEEAVAEIRALLRARGRTAAEFEVGSSATPHDLVDRLRSLGMRDAREPYVVAMVLVEEPPGVVGVEAHPVVDFDEYAAANEVMAAAFDSAERDVATWRQWWDQRDAAITETFVAVLDGTPVGAASATFSEAGVILNGGSVLPDARGRGAYRALVRARWDEAVRRGKPALVTQAGQMSRPILERVGFVTVAEIRVLLDEF